MTDEENNPHLLIQFLYGKKAQAALQEAEAKLLAWSRAFDAWLVSRQGRCSHTVWVASRAAWREFLGFKPLPPWQVTPAQVQDWIDHEQQRGMKPSTISHRLYHLASFYRYCASTAETCLAPAEGEAVFNPIREAMICPPAKPRKASASLSLEAAQALLAAIDRDTSLLGKRDYAFFLLLITTGQEALQVRGLIWGDLRWKRTRPGLLAP